MNEIENLLGGDKLMPEIRLRKLGFTCSASGPFTKNKERIQKFMLTGNTNYIYKNDLKACFQHNIVYAKYKDLTKCVLQEKAFEIASNPKYDGYEKGLASMVYNFFDKKSAKSSGINSVSNEQLADKLHKPIIRKFKSGRVYLSFKDTTWRMILLICNQ